MSLVMAHRQRHMGGQANTTFELPLPDQKVTAAAAAAAVMQLTHRSSVKYLDPLGIAPHNVRDIYI